MRTALSIFLCLCLGITIAGTFTITVDEQELAVANARDMYIPRHPLAHLFMNNFFAKNVMVKEATYLNRPALKVAFTEQYQNSYRTGATVQSSAYLKLPLTRFFYEGIIDVDIAAENNKYADELSRAFAGVIFRIDQTVGEGDCVYLRMRNGRLNNPQPPADRLSHAIQYISPPEWDFAKLREQFPGVYEAGANIAEKRWNHLRLVVRNNTVTAYVDNELELKVSLLRTNAAPGSIAFFAGNATDAYFSNLRITNTF